MSHHCDSHSELGHIIPFKVYMSVFAALLFLTVVTVLATLLDYGSSVNLIIAMSIASVKAGMVALYFMHLKYEDGATWLFVFFPIAILAIMLAGLFIDNPMRDGTVPMKPVKAVVADK